MTPRGLVASGALRGVAALLFAAALYAGEARAAAYVDPEGAFSLPELAEWGYRGEADRGVTLICNALTCSTLPSDERELCSVAVHRSDEVTWTDEVLREAVGRSVFEEAGVEFGSVAEMKLDADPEPEQVGDTLWISGFYSGNALADKTPVRAGMWITAKGPVMISLACAYTEERWGEIAAALVPLREGFRWQDPK